MASLYLLFIACSLGGTLASFYLQPQEQLPVVYYYQHQKGYWPESDRSQEYEDDQGFRYHQSYQNSYQQNLQYRGYPAYHFQYTVPQGAQQLQVPQEVQHHQVPQDVQHPRVPQEVQHHQVPQDVQHPRVPQEVHQSQVPQDVPQQHPAYQLLTVGPEVPVLVKLPDQRTTILPARTVYSLPGFLEGIVQNVQNYYSVFSPLEVLKVQRNNSTVLFHPAPPSVTPASTSDSASSTSNSSSSTFDSASSTSSSSSSTSDSTSSTSSSTSTPEEAPSSSSVDISTEEVTTDAAVTSDTDAEEASTETSTEAPSE